VRIPDGDAVRLFEGFPGLVWLEISHSRGDWLAYGESGGTGIQKSLELGVHVRREWDWKVDAGWHPADGPTPYVHLGPYTHEVGLAPSGLQAPAASSP
jgi:hypothetical protein